jgi:hypothetical protein
MFGAGIEHMISMILDDGVFRVWWTNALRQLYDYVAEFVTQGEGLAEFGILSMELMDAFRASG